MVRSRLIRIIVYDHHEARGVGTRCKEQGNDAIKVMPCLSFGNNQLRSRLVLSEIDSASATAQFTEYTINANGKLGLQRTNTLIDQDALIFFSFRSRAHPPCHSFSPSPLPHNFSISHLSILRSHSKALPPSLSLPLFLIHTHTHTLSLSLSLLLYIKQQRNDAVLP